MSLFLKRQSVKIFVSREKKEVHQSLSSIKISQTQFFNYYLLVNNGPIFIC